MIDLGTLGGTASYAVAMNVGGQVVGFSTTPGDVEGHAFSWTEAGGMVDLGTLGGTSSFAAAVNASGQVVGSSWTAGDIESHAFSWTAGGRDDRPRHARRPNQRGAYGAPQRPGRRR